MRKLFAFDIDGTLVDHNDHKIPPSALESLKDLKKQGHIVGIATGRNRSQLNKVLDMTMFDFIILNNGGHGEINGQEVINHPFKEDEVTKIFSLLEANDCEYIITDELQLYARQPNHPKVQRIMNIFDLITPLESMDLKSKKIYQIIVCENISKSNEISRLLKDYIINRFGDVFGFDINQKGITKGKALQEIIQYFNINMEDVYAFGDAENDLDFVKVAGTGIAMGNAVQVVKDVADYITTKNSENGIYKALKHFGFVK